VQQFLAEKNIPVISRPPYTPDPAPNDFWLFPALKMGLKGTRFATMEDIESNAMTSALPIIPLIAQRQSSSIIRDWYNEPKIVAEVPSGLGLTLPQ
jgi:hypothetical protein